MIAAGAAFVLAACGGDSDVATDVGAELADAGGDTVDTGGAGDVTADSVDADAASDTVADAPIDTTPDPACEVDWVVFVEGSAVTDEGEPAVDASAQLCVRIGATDGNLVCLRPEPTDAAGEFAIVVPESARCAGGGSMHVYDYDGTVAPMYCHVETANVGGTLVIGEPTVLFETDAVAELPPWGDPTVARAITFPGGLQIAEFVPRSLGFLFTEVEYANLGARRVDPNAEGLCFLTAPVDALWAFRVEADVKGSFGIRVPNEQEYPSGAAVDLYVLGGIETTLPGGAPLAETEWKLYGQGAVTDDGAWIVGDLPAFTWFGYALAD